MGSHPINLSVRFLLELVALIVFGIWGKQLNEGWTGYVWAILFPLLVAVIWGTFAVPDDPSRSGAAPFPVSGFIRLIVEGLIFGSATFLLFKLNYPSYGWLYGVIVLIHYLISYDRIWWLLKN